MGRTARCGNAALSFSTRSRELVDGKMGVLQGCMLQPCNLTCTCTAQLLLRLFLGDGYSPDWIQDSSSCKCTTDSIGITKAIVLFFLNE